MFDIWRWATGNNLSPSVVLDKRDGKVKMLLYIFLPMIIVGLAQWKVRKAFKKYSQIPAERRMNGAQVAQSLLSENVFSHFVFENLIIPWLN